MIFWCIFWQKIGELDDLSIRKSGDLDDLSRANKQKKGGWLIWAANMGALNHQHGDF